MANLRQEGCWESHYQLELRNYEEDGDEGEVWFGKGLNRRIVTWLVARLNAASSSNVKPIRVVDVGCGNAFTLCSIIERCNDINNLQVLGLDYSKNSIELAQKIVNNRGLSESVHLKQCDFLDPARLKSVISDHKYNYVIDIGTFDAICLLASNKGDHSLEDTKQRYIESLYSLVEAESVFIMASCNHTEEELLKLFDHECDNKLAAKAIDKIETPKIQFGGQTGSQVTCLIFEFA